MKMNAGRKPGGPGSYWPLHVDHMARLIRAMGTNPGCSLSDLEATLPMLADHVKRLVLAEARRIREDPATAEIANRFFEAVAAPGDLADEVIEPLYLAVHDRFSTLEAASFLEGTLGQG